MRGPSPCKSRTSYRYAAQIGTPTPRVRYDEAMRRITVHTDGGEYTIAICHNLADGLDHLRRIQPGTGKRRNFILTSPDIWALWGRLALKGFDQEPTVLFLPPGERSKRLAQVERLAAEMAYAGADRSALLLAFGGGVVGDLGGFLASIYMRGIAYIQIPTTLLAQVDSSIGGKTGVNLLAGKNLIGSFHYPRAVVAATEVLKTLPPRQLHAGLYESIKAGLIRDRELLRFIEDNRDRIAAGDSGAIEKVVAASARMKAEVVELDVRESGLRMILNFGHTIGHAIEAEAGYGRLLHGEAIAWGMLTALYISQKRGWLTEADSLRAGSLIRSFHPPLPPETSISVLLGAASRDKKNRAGTRRFILLKGLGNAVITEDVTDAEITEAIQVAIFARKPGTKAASRSGSPSHRTRKLQPAASRS